MGKRGPKPSGGQTPIFNLRLPTDLRAQLNACAESKGRALSKEIIKRLEDSLRQDREIEKQFGGKENYRIMQVLNFAIERAQQRRNSSWLDDPEAFEFVLQTFNSTIEGIRPAGVGRPQNINNYRASREIARSVWREIFEADEGDPLHQYRRIRADLERVVDRPLVYRDEFDARMEKRLDDLLSAEPLHASEAEAGSGHTREYLQMRSALYRRALEEVENEMKAEGKNPRLDDEDQF